MGLHTDLLSHSHMHTHTHTTHNGAKFELIGYGRLRAYELIRSSFACQVGISQTSSPWTLRNSPRQLDQLQLSTALIGTVIIPYS